MEDRNPQSALVCVWTAPLGDEGNPARHCVRGIVWYTLKIAFNWVGLVRAVGTLARSPFSGAHCLGQGYVGGARTSGGGCCSTSH